MDLSVAEAWFQGERIFVGIIRDITERKRNEAVLRNSKAALEASVAELQAKNEEMTPGRH